MTLSSVFSTLVWWEWAVYACGYLSCIGLAIWLYVMQRAEHSQSVSLALNSLSLTPMQEIPMPRLQRRGRQTVYIAMGTILVYILGIGSREAWLLTASSHLDHAKVTQQISNKEFYFRTLEQPRVHGIFCEIMPFKEGMRVSIKFESHLYCWSVRESGLNYFIEQGDQNEDGWNTYANPHANTYPVAFTNPTR